MQPMGKARSLSPVDVGGRECGVTFVNAALDLSVYEDIYISQV
jgi:hypothetical protein